MDEFTDLLHKLAAAEDELEMRRQDRRKAVDAEHEAQDAYNAGTELSNEALRSAINRLRIVEPQNLI